MKKLLFQYCLVVIVALFATSLKAQLKTPSASPSIKITQEIGLSEVTIEYARPGVKNRTIFAEDGLVPFGKMWRTGANSATKITFGADVKIGGQDLKKGSYAILSVPDATSWKVNFYEYKSGNWGSYREMEPAASVSAKVTNLPMSIERFFITVGNITDDGGDLEFLWDKTLATIPMKFEVESKVLAAIDKTLGGPSANDYYAAGSYLLSIDKDLDKALMYVQKATKGENPRFWQVRREAIILSKLGRKGEAIEAAKLSKDLAEKAGNEDYVRLNEKSIAEWMQ